MYEHFLNKLSNIIFFLSQKSYYSIMTLQSNADVLFNELRHKSFKNVFDPKYRTERQSLASPKKSWNIFALWNEINVTNTVKYLHAFHKYRCMNILKYVCVYDYMCKCVYIANVRANVHTFQLNEKKILKSKER